MEQDLTTPRSGLYKKFNVQRIIGQDKPGEEFFVLSPTHDPFARVALEAYAKACEEGIPELAKDIRAGLESVAQGEGFLSVIQEV